MKEEITDKIVTDAAMALQRFGLKVSNGINQMIIEADTVSVAISFSTPQTPGRHIIVGCDGHNGVFRYLTAASNITSEQLARNVKELIIEAGGKIPVADITHKAELISDSADKGEPYSGEIEIGNKIVRFVNGLCVECSLKPE